MKKTLLATCAILALGVAGQASATDFSFTGNLSGPNDFVRFNFSVGSTSTVTLRSYSYAGGTNAAGMVISAGGFDPILSLYNAAGNQIASQDDGNGVPTDPASDRAYDVNFSRSLVQGNYSVLISAYNNSCAATISGGCPGGGSFTSNGSQRTSAFAFDVLNVDTAAGPGAVPEPATWAMMLLGFGMVGAAARYRRRASTISYC